MITVLDCKPAGLLACPTTLSSKELERLITVSAVTTILVRGVTANYLRRLVRNMTQVFKVSEGVTGCVMERISAPRGTTDLNELDLQIIFHGERLTALLLDRAATVIIQPQLQAVIDENTIGALEEEAVTVDPPEGLPAEDFDINSIWGDKAP